MNNDKQMKEVKEILGRFDGNYRFSLDEFIDLVEKVLPLMDGSERAKDLAISMVSLSGASTDTDGGIAGMGEEQKKWLHEVVFTTFGGWEIDVPMEEEKEYLREEIEKYRKEKTATE